MYFGMVKTVKDDVIFGSTACDVVTGHLHLAIMYL
jgi:hypothetical protein